MSLDTLSETVYPVSGKQLPNIIPGIVIGFRVVGSVTLAYIWINKKLRIGVANCSMKDQYNQIAGEKWALKLAMAQQDTSRMMRTVLWDHYLYQRGIKSVSILNLFLVQAIEDMNYRYMPEK